MGRLLHLRCQCPACKSGDVRHSRWRGAEALFTLGLIAPYRCRKCDIRFWRPRKWLRQAVVLLPWVALLIVAMMVTWYALQHYTALPPPE